MSRGNGFSTLELLLSLAIVSLIVGGVSGGLRIGQQAWRAQRANEARSEIEASARAMSQLFEKCAPTAAARGSQGPTLFFVGQQNSVDFVYLSEGANQWGGFIRARIGLDPEFPDKLVLWTAVFRPETAWTVGAQDMQKSDLLDGVARFELEFLGAEPGKASNWRTDWIEHERLPRLVRVRVQRSRGAPAQSIEFVARLRLS